MYCRNCGNEVSEKAVGCPKCGLNPRSEKNYCLGCGVVTNPNQVVCTQCGISLANTQGLSLDTAQLQETLKNIDVNKLIKNPAFIAWAIAFVGYFLPWIKYSESVRAFGMNQSGALKFSGAKLGGEKFSFILDSPAVSSILMPGLLYLFPLVVIAIILSDFVPQIAKYKRYLVIGALVLIVYATVGIFTTSLEMPEMARGLVDTEVGFSAGWGLYVTLLGTIAGSYFSGLLSKNK